MTQIAPKHPAYTYLKGHIYYFSRVIPADLKSYYYKPRVEPDIQKYVDALTCKYQTQCSLVGDSVNKLMLDNAVFLEEGGDSNEHISAIPKTVALRD